MCNYYVQYDKPLFKTFHESDGKQKIKWIMKIAPKWLKKEMGYHLHFQKKKKLLP